MRTVLYRLLVTFLGLVTRVFFRTIEVVGGEHVPREGPVVFVGNHPNSLIDPVLVITTCGRRVNFAAKDTLFANPMMRGVLWAIGAVPIKRRQDHDGSDAKVEEKVVDPNAPPVDNSSAFEALFAVLRGGGAFGIFPEGISHTRSELAPLKTGAARIALGAAKEGVPVRIVPCGLSYRRRDRMRSRVLVQFGEAIEVDVEQMRALERGEHHVARELTADIESALRALTINAPDFDTLQVMDGVRRLYRPKGMSLTLAQQAELTRRFMEYWDRHQKLPEVAQLYGDVAAYMGRLEELGIRDRDLVHGVSLGSRLLRIGAHLLLLLAFLPLALPGLLLHLPAIVLAVIAGENLTNRGDVRATVKMVVVTLAVLGGYLLSALAVLWAVGFPAGVPWAVATLLALLLSGWATIRVLETQRPLRRGLAVLLTLFDLERELVRLGEQRDALRTRLLEMVERLVDPNLERIVPAGDHERHAEGEPLPS